MEYTWEFKTKSYPDGELRKFKARLYVRRDQQIDGVNVVDTYTPVVVLITVELLLVLSVVLSLQTQQVDYSNRFCQLSLEHTVFIELPAGFMVQDKVPLLQQSVYGLRQTPLDFYDHLWTLLEAR